MEGMSNYQKNLFIKKDELLLIALFDLWISNEDRNANNYNLLCDITNGYRFVPIDHQAIFNHGSPGDKLRLLTDGDSLLSTPIFQMLFSRKELSNADKIARLKNAFYSGISKCNSHLKAILSEIPEDWNIKPEVLVVNLRQTIFEENWLKEVWSSFLEILQITFNRK